MKKRVIFADQEEIKLRSSVPAFLQKPEQITLSRGEYSEVIKEAYKEGAKDALHDKNPSALTDAQQNSAEEGKRDAARSESQKHEETKQKLQAIANRKDIELLRARTIFPFKIFPDTIIIDTTKVTIIRKQMFLTEHITTIPLKDIADATVQTALFMATLVVCYMPQANSPGMMKSVEEHITSLKREDAIKAKNILKGVLVAKAEDIDIAQLDPTDIQNVVEKFGSNEGVE